MRCKLGPKKVKRLREKTGLRIVHATTRGGTDHRIDLFLDDGRIISLFKDGSLAACFISSWIGTKGWRKYIKQLRKEVV